jgi:hypothetical protein
VTAEPQVGDDGFYEDWPKWAKRTAMTSPERHQLRKLSWAQMLPPEKKTPKATRSYIEWMRLTHNGRRTPLTRDCTECGDHMTDEEIAEYREQFVPGRGKEDA